MQTSININKYKTIEYKKIFSQTFPFNCPEISKLFKLFQQNNASLYFVGGIVRDTILNKQHENPSHLDVDMCVNLPVENVETILKNNKIKYIPTGIKFGTITVLLNNIKIELTSTRKDIETFGRDATTIFTDCIYTDSLRRDFTFNALYVNGEFELYDFHCGVEHATDKKIKFIGNIKSRIEEDHLRIHRFIRFISTFSDFKYDEDDFIVIKNNINLVTKISVERKAEEIKKALRGVNFVSCIKILQKYEILNYIIPFKISEDFENLKNLYKNMDIEFFIICFFKNKTISLNFATHFKLGKKTLNNIKQIHGIIDCFKTNTPQSIVYNNNKEITKKCFQYLNQIKIINEDKLNFILNTIDGFQIPTFPLTSNHLIEMGIKPGPNFGALLATVEKWWIDNNFKPRLNDCILYLKRIEK